MIQCSNDPNDLDDPDDPDDPDVPVMTQVIQMMNQQTLHHDQEEGIPPRVVCSKP